MVKVTWGHVTSITWQDGEDQSHDNEDSGHVGGESEVASTDMKWLGLNVVSSVNHTGFVEWVESPIRAHNGLVLPEIDKDKESGESPVPLHSELALSEANQHKEWVESPIRSHDNKLGLVQVEQNRHSDRPASSSCFREMQGFGILTQEPPLQHSGSVPDSPQQAFLTFEANETSVSPFAEPVPLLPPGCMQHGIGIVDYATQQNQTWSIEPQVETQYMWNTNPHHLEPMASRSCVRCTCPIDACAKFCICCGEKQPSPLGMANPMCEAHCPYYQYQLHPISEAPWLELSTH